MRLQARFFEHVQITPGCWLWTGCKLRNGYPQFRLNGETVYAHHLSHEWAFGPITEGWERHHVCRVRHCVRPDHIIAVTRQEHRSFDVVARNGEAT